MLVKWIMNLVLKIIHCHQDLDNPETMGLYTPLDQRMIHSFYILKKLKSFLDPETTLTRLIYLENHKWILSGRTSLWIPLKKQMTVSKAQVLKILQRQIIALSQIWIKTLNLSSNSQVQLSLAKKLEHLSTRTGILKTQRIVQPRVNTNLSQISQDYKNEQIFIQLIYLFL